MFKNRLDALRREHDAPPLRRGDLDADPVRQFSRWFDEAVQAGVAMPNAMALATASGAGIPSVRMVLLKDCDERGLVFYTNFNSRKGRELEENRHAAIVFYWDRQERQVRVSGTVSKVSREEAEAYFQSRPLGSRLSAAASPQSQAVECREVLEAAVAKLRAEQQGRPPALPDAWGGYRLKPEEFEFWQGRLDRLHDRFRYRREDDGWRMERLAP